MNPHLRCSPVVSEPGKVFVTILSEQMRGSYVDQRLGFRIRRNDEGVTDNTGIT